MRIPAVGLLVISWGVCACDYAFADDIDVTPFTDVSEKAGIRFRHFSPLSPERHLHLFMGSGIAWLDHDRDGWPDLFLGQGREWPQQESPDTEHTDRLLRNRGDGTFVDVTFAARTVNLNYSMGTAVGDYDNDGFADLFVSAFGPNQLFRNNGDGTFTSVAAELGLDDGRFGAGCTWGDLDADGSLDLFVCNYLKLDRENYPLCHDQHEGVDIPATCAPRKMPSDHDIVYLNRGDGTFEDVSKQIGILDEPSGGGLGVVIADLDADGDFDIYVANDSVPNQMWVNDGQGRFADHAIISGTAVNRSGSWEAGMGLVIGDVDGDARFDLFVTNYFNETNTLYRNEGGLFFLDATREYGLGSPSQTRLAFGTSLFDVDNDGWLDLFVANGHIHTHLEQLGRNEPFEQLPQLFMNQAGKRFVDASADGGAYFRKPTVGRSSATADFNRDGKTDLAVGHLNGPVVLLQNESATSGQSVVFELIGTASCRDGIGVVVEVESAGTTRTLLRTGSAGYLSNNEGVVTAGIGNSRATDRVVVRWPSGLSESWQQFASDRRYQLVEGTGTRILE